MTTEQIAKLANDTLACENKITQLCSWEASARKGGVNALVVMGFSDSKFARSQLKTYLDDNTIIALIGTMILKEKSKLFQLEAQMEKLKKA